MAQKNDKIDQISQLLLEYSAGNYDYKGAISDELDEYDMMISGINMLGEELEATNVSKDYFSSIFNSVTDLVAILDQEGHIKDSNLAFEQSFSDCKGRHINHILPISEFSFTALKSRLKNREDKSVFEIEIPSNDRIFIGSVTMVQIFNRFDEFQGYLVSIRDITAERKSESEVLKAIFLTQQKEQQRVADDLHDSLGQELSMTKLMLSHLKKNLENPSQAKELVKTCDEIIQQSINQVREICFDLMPGVLTRGGLRMGINDLIKKLGIAANYKIDLTYDIEDGLIGNDLEIVLYRIVQEFINNMIKHAEANVLKIHLKLLGNETIQLYLSDNGKGFDMTQLSTIGENRGYQNLLTKTKAFNGKLNYSSIKGEGTTLDLKFPLTPKK